MKIQYLCSLILGLQFFSLSAQTTLNLDKSIQNLSNDPALKHATWSISVVSVDDNALIASHNSNLSVVPASTLKTITTGASLAILGDNFQFNTTLSYTGAFDKATGIITGDVYIVGGGDPSLGSKYFQSKQHDSTVTQQWAKILLNAGVKQIKGAVIADTRIFPANPLPSNWTWGDMGNYYGAGVSGLSYRDNTYTIHFKSGAKGSKTSILKTTPHIEGLKIVNTVRANGSSDNAYIYGAPYSNYRMVEGTIPPNRVDFKVKGSMPDPALYCAQEFTNSLRQTGIKVAKEATSIKQSLEAGKNTNTANRTTFYTHKSPKLKDIIYWLNLKSVNLFAEHLVYYLAYHKTGKADADEGLKAIKAFWEGVGVNVDGLVLNDGSGLSRSNVITTKTQAQALAWLAKSKHAQAFKSSLPVAGKSGSLKRMFKGTIAENNLIAKSGYLTRARGYTGYVKTLSGKLMSFSILANNYTCSASSMKKKMMAVMLEISKLN